MSKNKVSKPRDEQSYKVGYETGKREAYRELLPSLKEAKAIIQAANKGNCIVSVLDAIQKVEETL